MPDGGVDVEVLVGVVKVDSVDEPSVGDEVRTIVISVVKAGSRPGPCALVNGVGRVKCVCCVGHE